MTTGLDSSTSGASISRREIVQWLQPAQARRVQHVLRGPEARSAEAFERITPRAFGRKLGFTQIFWGQR